ncbi:T9SS type A sorting domain-containing protein [Seonamhaeicola algicola]|uniref:T9SS type A sorting domain-containing protein n=1 Tax=Seonamhaeicola algicola TaxID=1719036 RepID=A0A5C7APN2_9FLAO|nr:T9SS type A sorting domain-containing protein [Seonamhaeicola algicola]TXE09639.1 T9SS type A sorting domain-containing protein [Seonamhaeicola algicola]
MAKNYFLSVFFILAFLFCNYKGTSQNYATDTPVKENIEGLSIYPNPVNSGHTYIYISSKKNLVKHVEFFNVIGKLIYNTKLIGKELNIANLSKGVYILKITENNISETRKLVIK